MTCPTHMSHQEMMSHSAAKTLFSKNSDPIMKVQPRFIWDGYNLQSVQTEINYTSTLEFGEFAEQRFGAIREYNVNAEIIL